MGSIDEVCPRYLRRLYGLRVYAANVQIFWRQSCCGLRTLPDNQVRIVYGVSKRRQKVWPFASRGQGQNSSMTLLCEDDSVLGQLWYGWIYKVAHWKITEVGCHSPSSPPSPSPTPKRVRAPTHRERVFEKSCALAVFWTRDQWRVL